MDFMSKRISTQIGLCGLKGSRSPNSETVILCFQGI